MPLSSCGNGTVDPLEQCDHGANNGTATDTRDAHCRFRCGNGIKDSDEACDDGVNSGALRKPDCTLAAYCGDGVKNDTRGLRWLGELQRELHFDRGALSTERSANQATRGEGRMFGCTPDANLSKSNRARAPSA
jgi:hypothetical protein